MGAAPPEPDRPLDSNGPWGSAGSTGSPGVGSAGSLGDRDHAAHDGVLAAARLACERPARLGATRLVAVDGPSGSGKTSVAPLLAGAIAEALDGAVMVPQRSDCDAGSASRSGDAPCVPDAGRSPAWAPRAPTSGRLGGVGRGVGQWASREGDAPGGAVRTEAMHTGPTGAVILPTVAVVSTDLLATWEHPLDWWPVFDENLLAAVEAGRGATMPVLEWTSGKPRPGGVIELPPVDVLIVEGVSSGRQAVAERLSALVWVEVVGSAARLERAVARDGEAMRPYLERWQRQEAGHFAADGTRARADVLISPLR